MTNPAMAAVFGQMRPNTDPAMFATYDDFKIKAIRAWSRKLMGKAVTDAKILATCKKAKLVHRVMKRLDECSETELTRMFKWLGQQIFAMGFDSYFTYGAPSQLTNPQPDYRFEGSEELVVSRR